MDGSNIIPVIYPKIFRYHRFFFKDIRIHINMGFTVHIFERNIQLTQPNIIEINKILINQSTVIQSRIA